MEIMRKQGVQRIQQPRFKGDSALESRCLCILGHDTAALQPLIRILSDTDTSVLEGFFVAFLHSFRTAVLSGRYTLEFQRQAGM
jgi:hypothetical protein